LRKMTTTIEAIYENGVLRPRQALDLPDKSRVLVTIQSDVSEAADPERAEWLEASKRRLAETWGNAGDDVFNELPDR
jgi:predicted DNA-binding antitoxin AbrB/MazE fold protein